MKQKYDLVYYDYETERRLCLIKTHIRAIPPEIGNLKYLIVLNLSSNSLKTIPPEIGSLEFLETLNLSNNQLTSLPPQCTSLKNLAHLLLVNNHFKEISSQISGLVTLKSLSLFNNQVDHIPPEFWHHNTLQYLNIARNQLKKIHLPNPILQINLLTLNLCENPFPPFEKKWARHLTGDIEDFFSYYHLREALFQKYAIFIHFIDNDLLPMNLDTVLCITTSLWRLYFKANSDCCHRLSLSWKK